MATPTQLPDDFIDGYWGVVIEELCDHYRMSQQDAEAAVAVYRERMVPAGDTIYNDSTRESARRARYSFQRQRREGKTNLTSPVVSPKTRPQLAADLVEDYWEVVVKELRDLGLSDTDAKVAAGGYRAYMKPVEWAVYNDSPAETAKMAQLWLQRDKPAGSAEAAKPKHTIDASIDPDAFSVISAWLITTARQYGCGELISLILEYCGPRHSPTHPEPATDDSIPLVDQLASHIEQHGILKTLPLPLKLPQGTHHITTPLAAARIGIAIMVQFLYSAVRLTESGSVSSASGQGATREAPLAPDAATRDMIRSLGPEIITALFDLRRDVRSIEIITKVAETLRPTDSRDHAKETAIHGAAVGSVPDQGTKPIGMPKRSRKTGTKEVRMHDDTAKADTVPQATSPKPPTERSAISEKVDLQTIIRAFTLTRLEILDDLLIRDAAG